MAKELWLAFWATLLLLSQVESPPLRCPHGEYYHSRSGYCCKKCPAGTHVSEHCRSPGTSSGCKSCQAGESYTASENGLETCLLCEECKFGKIKVEDCTVESNTKCQCKEGYYCPPGYEECQRCRTKCPQGEEIVHKCNATADMECKLSSGGATSATCNNTCVVICVIISVSVILIVLSGIAIFMKRKCVTKKQNENVDVVSSSQISASTEALLSDTTASASERQKIQSGADCVERKGLLEHGSPCEGSNLPVDSTDEMCEEPGSADIVSVPPKTPNSNAKYPVVRFKNPSCKDLRDSYYTSRHSVPLRNWKMLMRGLDLSDNDIETITMDNPGNADEQRYQMLKTVEDRFGIEDAFRKLLNGLWTQNCRLSYDNIKNDLINKDMIIIENED